MLRQESALGNYFDLAPADLGFPMIARETMVALMEELHTTRGYQE